MFRTHSCGVLRLDDKGRTVELCGWVHRLRDMGSMLFIDLRDRYGIMQLVFDNETKPELYALAKSLGREYVIKVKGVICERSNKNSKIPTGDIEMKVEYLELLNESKIPPFTLEENSDGGDELRMKFRYLDLRREPVKNNIVLRHKLALETRNFLNELGFLEIETPFLIKSTPEGARDFVVPSRLNPGQFYALPQSPQQYKQLLMVAGFDRYYQIVRCFRDEDLRADRQPEFTQIDCEMSFVEQKDILFIFEEMTKSLLKKFKGINCSNFQRISYSDALALYGTDKPDLRFDMRFFDLTSMLKQIDFSVFKEAEYIIAFCAKACAGYSRKELDDLTEFVRKPQIGAKGLAYIKHNADGSFKSSIDKYLQPSTLNLLCNHLECEAGDLIFIMAGKKEPTQKALCELRLEMGRRLGLMDDNKFVPLWVVDFPMFEWDEETQRYYAKHHPFTSPKSEDMNILETNTVNVRADAYDLVINGVEVGGGSIRIHNKELQRRIFKILGFSDELAEAQFGFLMDAFEYGAPPHAGIAFGFDRLCSLF
ncbi:MAG: aspartate--tRNA ligase, partial [Bacteroidales bacterium]|nr:aspartate--tRNA ligase [Bacteroidales bacterium]